MPFDRSSSFKLMLAIAAALSATQAHADNDQQLWNCSLNASGEWDCDIDARPLSRPSSTSATAKDTADRAPTPTTPSATSAPVTDPVPDERARGSATDSQNSAATDGASQPDPSTDTASSQARVTATGTAASQDQAPQVTLPYLHLDWYTYAPGDEGYNGVCSGEYREPDLNLMQANTPAEQQTIFLEALHSSTVLGGITQLEGGINMRQGGRLLSSDQAEYDPNKQLAALSGNVSYREQGLLLRADTATADLSQSNADFNNAEFVLHPQHLRGEAAQLARVGEERFVMDDGRVTFCEPGNSDWAISADELEIHTDEGYGEARHMTFEVADVPVLYLPYFYFPIDDRRRSGFLYPSLSYSDSDGYDIATPYYFNLAPNYDDTFTPRYVSERGMVLENEFRYLNDWSMNTLSTAYMPDDDLYGDSRWALGIEHNGNPYGRWYTRIDYQRISDDDYLDDLDTTNLDLANEDDLDQIAEVRYQADNWQFTGRVHQYQTIDDGTEPYESVPQLLFTGNETALDGDVRFNYQAEYTYFDRDNEDLTGSSKTVGGRLHLRPSISYSWERPWAWAKPSVTYWHSRYNLNDQPDSWSSSEDLSVPIFSVDSGLRMEREYGNGLVQTLEPRLKLISAASEDQSEIPDFDSSRLSFNYYNLFSDTGYSGNDRIAGTNQATLGLSSSFYNDSGIQQAQIAMAQAYYFEDRDEDTGLRPGDEDGTESRSKIALLASWNISPALTFTHDSAMDDEDMELVQQNYSLKYQPDDSRLLYLSYRDNTGFDYEDEDDDDDDYIDQVRQADLGFRWPLSPAWGIVGRWRQAMDYDVNLESLLGVEYSSCCWKIRLTGRQWIDDIDDTDDLDDGDYERDEGIFLEFVLRGLGSFGQSGGREFLEDITGKEEDAHENF